MVRTIPWIATAGLGLILAGCQSPQPGQAWPVRARAKALSESRPGADALHSSESSWQSGEPEGPKVLCVYAHPDDETSVAALLYKTGTHLKGSCDIALITNGEGGFKYSTLAEDLYGLELTDEAIGRSHLPEIRRSEFLEGCAIMQIRSAYFLEQQDHRYSTDPMEVLARDANIWDLDYVHDWLVTRLEAGGYDFVLTMAATPSTHGHHQAATLLALRAVNSLPVDKRPAILCSLTETAEHQPDPPAPLHGFPETAIQPLSSPLVFDRTQSFGHRSALDYTMIVNWVIAAHKSQGTMQRAMSKGIKTHLFLFALSPEGSAARAQGWLASLAQPQFAARTYTQSAGTNASSPAPRNHPPDARRVPRP